MGSTKITNVSTIPLVLPTPYAGVLPGGANAFLSDGVTGALGILAGSQYAHNVFAFQASAPNAPSAHSAKNLDETLSANGAISVTTQQSRMDINAAGANMAMTLANGLFVGQRKDIMMSTAPGGHTVTITPATMAESHSFVTLTNRYDLVELEWQSVGWKVVLLTGAASVT